MMNNHCMWNVSLGFPVAPRWIVKTSKQELKHALEWWTEHYYLHSLFVLSQEFRRKFTKHFKERQVRRGIVLSFLILIFEGKLYAISMVKIYEHFQTIVTTFLKLSSITSKLCPKSELWWKSLHPVIMCWVFFPPLLANSCFWTKWNQMFPLSLWGFKLQHNVLPVTW